MFFIGRFAFLGALLCTFAFSLETQDIHGSVLDHLGKPVRDAKIQIVDLNRQVKVSKDGTFLLSSVEKGTHQLLIQSPYLGASKMLEITVTDQRHDPIQVQLDMEVHTELIVTARSQVQSISDISQSSTVLADEELNFNLQNTLGESVARIPGISSASFGQGSSRPVIRGMSGERLRILDAGVDAGDVSSIGPDHGVAIEPFLIERVEILKGASTLRYGENAIGGVINAIDNRIPEHVPSTSLEGSVTLHGNTVSDERTGAVSLTGGKKEFAWHVDFLSRDANDLSVPEGSIIEEDEHGDHEEDELDHEEPGDVLPNSFVETTKASVGVSWIKDRHFVGIAFSGLDHLYGLPVHAHHHEEDGHDHKMEEGEEDGVHIDMEDRRFDLRGSYRLEKNTIESINYQIGSVDYQHTEFEGDVEGTIFKNRFFEMRTEVNLNAWGPFSNGSIGIHGKNRDFSAQGEEAYVAPNETDSWAAFWYEEIQADNWKLDLGIRLTRNSIHADFYDLAHDHEDEHDHKAEEADVPLSRDFDLFSASFGAVRDLGQDYKLAFSINTTERAPTAEELFAAGPHTATQAFEIGNPLFEKESGLNYEANIRKTHGRLSGEVNLFYNDFENYIFQLPEEEEEIDGLQVFHFHQTNATLYGGELHADLDLIHTDPHHLRLGWTLDTVRGQLDHVIEEDHHEEEGGDEHEHEVATRSLPRIPPMRFKMQLLYQYESIWVRLESVTTEDQDRVATLETPTDGFTFLNAAISWQFFVGNTIQQIMLRGTNLGDEIGRNHASFVKEQVPLPGRDISLTWRMRF